VAQVFVFDTASGELVRHDSTWDDKNTPVGVLPGDQLGLWQEDRLTVYTEGGETVEIPKRDDGTNRPGVAFVAGSVVVLPRGGEESHRYAAWDLEMGAQLWKEKLPGHVAADAADDGRLLVDYTVATGQGGDPHLGWLDMRDGSVSDAGAFTSFGGVRMHLVTDDPVVYAIEWPGNVAPSLVLVAYELPA
jgi:hypothetical protein